MTKESSSKVINVHDGHRKRMRERYLETKGFNGFADHEILELLLFYIIPRKDVNALSHDIINRFGTLQKVFLASVDELTTIKDVGLQTALYINMIGQTALKITSMRAKEEKIVLNTIEKTAKFVSEFFIGKREEVVYMFCLDARCQFIHEVLLSEGDIDRANINIRDVIQKALFYNSNYVLISHNHPSGVCMPSRADISTTTTLMNNLRCVDINMIDHMIVAENGIYSFKTHGTVKWETKEEVYSKENTRLAVADKN